MKNFKFILLAIFLSFSIVALQSCNKEGLQKEDNLITKQKAIELASEMGKSHNKGLKNVAITLKSKFVQEKNANVSLNSPKFIRKEIRNNSIAYIKGINQFVNLSDTLKHATNLILDTLYNSLLNSNHSNYDLSIMQKSNTLKSYNNALINILSDNIR